MYTTIRWNLTLQAISCTVHTMNFNIALWNASATTLTYGCQRLFLGTQAIVERHVEVTLTSVFACCGQDTVVPGRQASTVADKEPRLF